MKTLSSILLTCTILGCGSSLPPPAEPKRPVPTVDVSLGEIPYGETQETAVASVTLSPSQWVRVKGFLRMPPNEQYSGEPLVATFCKPGKIEPHINPSVGMPAEQQEDQVEFDITVQAPGRPGRYDLLLLIHLQPRKMRAIEVKR